MEEATSKKKLLEAAIIGELGAALARLLILEMGSTWHSTTPLEVGIDSWIELRDPLTGEMTGLWIAAQSKAREGQFKMEDESSFVFECSGRDIAYWREMNAPVILIVSRPADREAWWRPVGQDACIRFDKEHDRLGPESYPALFAFASERPQPLYPAKATAVAQPKIDETGATFPFRPVFDAHPVPAVPIELSGPGGTLSTFGIIDTGADTTCLPYSYVHPLGVDLDASDSLQEIGDGSTIHVGSGKVSATVLDTKIPLDGVFASVPFLLLGRADFLSAFEFTIDQRRQCFKLRSWAA